MTFYEIEKFRQENPEETNSLNCSSWFPCSLRRHRRPVLWNNIFQEVFSKVYNSQYLSCPIWVIYGSVQRHISLLTYVGNLWKCTTAHLSLVLSGYSMELYNVTSLSCPIWVIYESVQRHISLLSYLGNLWKCTTLHLSLDLFG